MSSAAAPHPSAADSTVLQLQSACRICLSHEPDGLIQPCSCSGTLGSAHLACLEQWVAQKGLMECEVCRAPYKQQHAASLRPLAAAAVAALKQREQRVLHVGAGPGQSRHSMLKLVALMGLVLLFIATMGALVVVVFRVTRKA